MFAPSKLNVSFVLLLTICTQVASGLVGQDQAREAAGLVVDLIKVRHDQTQRID